MRVNGQITEPEVRVIGSDGEMLGVVPTDEALRWAREKRLDLVEVNASAWPPVCKIMRHYVDRPQAAEAGAASAHELHDQLHGKDKAFEERVVDTILLDMTGRRGLRHEWDRIDADVKEEIRATWMEIVRQAMEICPSCGNRSASTSTLCRYCDNDE
jgi:hypothetical protein